MIYRVFISVLILFLSIQTWAKTDNAKEFEIEGMSIGDSLLNFFSSEEIEQAEENPTYYPKSKKYKILGFYSKTGDLFDYINISIKNNDKNFIIYGIRGEKEMSLDACFEMKTEQINSIENMLSSVDKDEYKSGYGDNYGNSEAHVTEYYLKDGSEFRIFCTDWDSKNENVINNKWNDSLEVGINSKEFSYFLLNEAYN